MQTVKYLRLVAGRLRERARVVLDLALLERDELNVEDQVRVGRN